MPTDKQDAAAFHGKMKEVLAERRQIGLNGKFFRAWLGDYGGVEAAKKLLDADPKKELTDLLLATRLDLSVEALVLSREWSHLFSPVDHAKANHNLESLTK